MQAAQRAATPPTSKLVFLQMHWASMVSSDSSSPWLSLSARRRRIRAASLPGLMSHVFVSVTIGPQMAVHALGTSVALSSSEQAIDVRAASKSAVAVGVRIVVS